MLKLICNPIHNTNDVVEMSSSQSGKMLIAIILVVVIAAAGYSFMFLTGDQGDTTTTPTTYPTMPEILPVVPAYIFAVKKSKYKIKINLTLIIYSLKFLELEFS